MYETFLCNFLPEVFSSPLILRLCFEPIFDCNAAEDIVRLVTFPANGT